MLLRIKFLIFVVKLLKTIFSQKLLVNNYNEMESNTLKMLSGKTESIFL